MKLLATLAAIYLLFAGFMYLVQRKLQYFPDTRLLHAADAGLTDFETVFLQTPDGERLVAWFAPPQGNMPVIVYFHGNGAAIANRAERFRLFHATGYGVLALSYRGYGGSTGSPTETGLKTDGETAIDFLAKRGIPPARMVFFGESLGTGIAVALGIRHRPAAVILESPFTSAADVARRSYWFLPVGLLMKDPYPAIELMPKLTLPVMVLHNAGDEIIPVEHGRRMFAAAPGPKEMIELPGGSHVAPLTEIVWGRLDAFLRRHVRSEGT